MHAIITVWEDLVDGDAVGSMAQPLGLTTKNNAEWSTYQSLSCNKYQTAHLIVYYEWLNIKRET